MLFLAFYCPGAVLADHAWCELSGFAHGPLPAFPSLSQVASHVVTAQCLRPRSALIPSKHALVSHHHLWGQCHGLCVGVLGLPCKMLPTGGLTQQTFIFSPFWELQVQGRSAVGVGFWWGLAPWLADGPLLSVTPVLLELSPTPMARLIILPQFTYTLLTRLPDN